MNASLLGPGDPLWALLLAAIEADIYYLPGYVGLCARGQGGQPALFAAREEGRLWLLPLVLRRIPARLAGSRVLFDAETPYGYSGPLVRDGAEGAGDWSARAAAALLELLRGHGVVSLFARLHPLRAPALAPLARTGTLVRHGETVAIDLALPEDELWRQTRSRFRSAIHHLERDGFTATLDEGQERLDDFQAVYAETMQRVHAGPAYLFPPAYFQELRQALAGRLHLWLVERRGRLACAGLFTEMDGIVEYHLGGTADDFRRDAPSKLLFHAVRCWAKARGDRVLHLGGGVGGGTDSLFHFKAGFSSWRLPFHTWRVVVDPPAFEGLVTRWRNLSGLAPEGSTGFFPSYRRPLAA
jgi:hypothetical protein